MCLICFAETSLFTIGKFVKRIDLETLAGESRKSLYVFATSVRYACFQLSVFLRAYAHGNVKTTEILPIKQLKE